jgi:hypothetical protein
MFLAEVALGKEHGITKDNCSLVKPPPGYNSVVARGQTEPGTYSTTSEYIYCTDWAGKCVNGIK